MHDGQGRPAAEWLFFGVDSDFALVRITRLTRRKGNDGRDRKLLNSRRVGFWQHTGRFVFS